MVLPANATVVVTPSADQGVYATTYNYVAGSLVISAVSKVPLRATSVVGGAWTGRTVTVTIVGSGFYRSTEDHQQHGSTHHGARDSRHRKATDRARDRANRHTQRYSHLPHHVG